ncbi:transcriptional repressor DicA [Pragia fontium]|uniref:helix-turn-helix transcriptional regulator n=1 Tax=Pragia fontium TaxID=82985 RepID=UPI000E03FE40|nr:helix-turn-helix domain-containing protein [Pragia fontium]SUB82001.1 transcriptional repressor DicA [Pragia fontium]
MNTGNISERLKQRRTELCLSQSAVAKSAGITQQSVQAIEAGETKRPRHIVEISLALKCAPEYLLYGTKAPKQSS